MNNSQDTTNFLNSYMAMKNNARTRVSINRERIIAALKKLDITDVVILYSGSGDSGQLDEVSLYRGNEIIEADIELSYHLVKSQWNHKESKWNEQSADETCLLSKALHEFAYDWIESEHSGWEINEGSSGECTIEVSADSFHLLHKDYYIESEITEHNL